MTLHLYFARRFALTFAGVTAALGAMLWALEAVEELSDFTGTGAPLGEVLSLAALGLPGAIYQVLPLIAILSSLAAFIALSRGSELVATRAAGRSAIGALAAPVAVTLVLGALAVAVLNPLVAASSRAADAREARMGGEVLSVLEVTGDAVWLREGGPDGQIVLRATAGSRDGTTLTGATLLLTDATGRPTRRIEAARARLTEGAWALDGVKVWPLSAGNPEAAAAELATLTVASTLNAAAIRDSFGEPAAIPIWDLPRFIARLRDAGFSASRHAMFLHQQIALPAFLTAMVLIGAAAALRPQRGGRTGLLALMAVVTAFGVYYLRDFAAVLGEQGAAPAWLAAWAPPLAAIGLSLGLILHLEDG
ncbi:MAG: LPS export ABC transporter permease LptG [Paracoccaceae bacterium]